MSVDRKRRRCSLPSPSLIFPDEVRLCKSSVPGAKYGVCAAQPIPPGTWIGPYEGQVVMQEELREGVHNSFMWEVRKCYLKCHSVMNFIIHRTSFLKERFRQFRSWLEKTLFPLGEASRVEMKRHANELCDYFRYDFDRYYILGLQGPLVKRGQKDFNFHRKKRYFPLRLRSLRIGKSDCPGNPPYPHPQI